ncbi:sensor histidine kinase [Aneurinibacillus migulanus]|uniref:histidine kinase n=1 Tax=Aneurinibacillus migulanus TaxID=47500 RepID=A0A0D1XG04_ANEMI|nr:sensor histidine kinase [Aneurinibacillus migulanus]KIV51223.1 histidine kinase [Aneurinibacillus migulanus]KON94691.1 histidine kinase [Aneurinibacillus migulanus]MED0894777.1 sensor histidine kinase [Aneurinibacillus migulanus]MED1615265.1 sensor histidine kinase [Aneurinibacillus migulanus]MED4727825.1 sensor histidine kinase [Aneurinibacillus migulanus]
MIRRIYPSDQIENYLLIDVIAVVFLFYHMTTEPSPIGIIGNLLLFALFLTAFYISLWYRDWRLLASSLLGCAILTLFGIFVNKWLILYGFIIADLLGRANSKAHIAVGMAGIIAMFLIVNEYNGKQLFSFEKAVYLPTLSVQLLIPIVIYIRGKSKRLQSELNAANEKIARYIQEEERHRIARDLHDTLGQTLIMIKLKSELTIRLMEKDTGQAKQELTDILTTSRAALKQVRELVDSMKYVSLEEEINYAKHALQTAKIELTVKELASMPPLTRIAETMVALSIREAVTNTMKHSQANHCTITTNYQAGMYTIQVTDDGVGFTQATNGNGLQSIKERMQFLQGKAEIKAVPDSGVTVILTVPIQEERKEGI